MSEYKPIHMLSHQEWQDQEAKRLAWQEEHSPQAAEFTKKHSADRKPQRDAVVARFPFTVILQGCYPEHDYVVRWCWENIGPEDTAHHYKGLCHDSSSEYPGCPLVRATEYINKGSWKDQNGVEHHWEEPAYKEVEDHSHEGQWTAFWLGKTGYDYGSGEYCFANPLDRDRFLAAVPTFHFCGEKQEK